MKSSTDVRTYQAEPEPDAALDTSDAPIRLLAGGGSAFEQRLLESARVDHISSASRQRLATALKVPSSPVPVLLLRRLLQPVRGGTLGALAGLGAFALLAGWAARQWPSPAPAEPAREPPLLVAPSLAAPSSGAGQAPLSATPEVDPASPVVAHDAPPASASSPPVAPADRPSKRRLRVHATPSPSPAASPRTTAEADGAAARGGLREELRALEAVQSLVRAGHSGEAQRALDDYARRFPDGELGLEAELLGLDVSLARGERKQTRERVRALLARPEAARYRERLEALWQAAGGGPDATRLGSESTIAPHRRAEVTQ